MQQLIFHVVMARKGAESMDFKGAYEVDDRRQGLALARRSRNVFYRAWAAVLLTVVSTGLLEVPSLSTDQFKKDKGQN